MLDAAVGNANDIRQIGRPALCIRTSRAPGFRLPPNQRPVLLRAYYNFCIHRGALAGGHQFLVALEHHLYGTPRFLGEARAGESPAVGAELASEPAAHHRCEYAHFVGGADDIRFCDFTRNAANVLRGSVQRKVVAVPFRYLSMGLEDALSDEGCGIMAF